MVFKLICFDMDGVIFKDVNFWMELHKKFGTLEQGKVLTEKYLHTDYNKLVEEVVHKLWKGRDATPYVELVNSIAYNPGVQETFAFIKNQGFLTALISASSIDVARRVQQDFGVDHIFANTLVIKDNKVSGDFLWPIGAGNETKANIINRLCADFKIKNEEVIYVGDSKTDIAACQAAGLSIAFNSDCEKLKAITTHIVDSDNLSDIIPIIEKAKQ